MSCRARRKCSLKPQALALHSFRRPGFLPLPRGGIRQNHFFVSPLHCEKYLLFILGSFRLEEILSVALAAIYAKSDALNFRRAPWRI